MEGRGGRACLNSTKHGLSRSHQVTVTAPDAGIVDEHVHSTKGGFGRVEQAADRGWVADIGLGCECPSAVLLDLRHQRLGFSRLAGTVALTLAV
jgi:hypothetical protein